MNKRIPSVIALGIIITLSILIGGLLKSYSINNISGSVGAGVSNYFAYHPEDEKSDYEEELMEYIKKYCRGNNNNDEKCSKYCKKLDKDIDLCESRIISEEKSSYDEKKCERLCSKESDDFNKNMCNDYCGKYDKYNNNYAEKKKKTEETNYKKAEKDTKEKEISAEKVEKAMISSQATKERKIQYEIKMIQKNREIAEAKKKLTVKEVEDRDKLTTFLIGADQGNIDVLKEKIEENKTQIEKLNNITKKAESSESKNDIQKKVQEINNEQQELNKVISENENKFSLFGWVVKLFR